jgi:DNA-binding response OmpR family regulator
LDGFTICRRIREIPSLSGTRVIILTALTQRDEIVRGLESGADDYVTKPFDREILLARLHAVLRRGATMRMGEDFDGLRLEEENRLATLKEKRLKLSPGELKILTFLVAHRGRILGRAQILNAVQEEERSVTERTIDVQIATLRKKLGRWARHIETIRGIGYRVKV